MAINKLSRLLSLLFLLSSVCIQTSCKDTEEETGSNELSSKLQQYKWMTREFEFNEYDTYVELTQDVYVYYFISDSEGILRCHHKWIDTSGIDDEGHEISNSFFDYTVSGSKVKISLENGRSYSLTYDGTYLKNGDEYYKPLTPSAGD